jgi:hypothetical protein
MMIQGKNILAMAKDDTSITQMLTYMGVDPTLEIVSKAAASLPEDFTMTDVYNFLVSEGIMKGENPILDLR